MKKFHFTLDKMLRYKDSILEEEKNRLMQIRAEKNAVDTRIEKAEADLVQLDQERCEKASQGISVFELRTYAYHIENTNRHIKALIEEQEKLEKQIAKQLAVVIERTQEVSGLEKLRDKQREEYNQSVMKEEQENIMEMVTSKYIREEAPEEAAS